MFQHFSQNNLRAAVASAGRRRRRKFHLAWKNKQTQSCCGTAGGSGRQQWEILIKVFCRQNE
jgi:hypothetical protein